MELALNLKTLEFSHGYLDFWFLLKSQKTRLVWLTFPHNIICQKYISSCVFLSRYMLSTLMQASPSLSAFFSVTCLVPRRQGDLWLPMQRSKSTEYRVQIPARWLHCSSFLFNYCSRCHKYSPLPSPSCMSHLSLLLSTTFSDILPSCPSLVLHPFLLSSCSSSSSASITLLFLPYS